MPRVIHRTNPTIPTRDPQGRSYSGLDLAGTFGGNRRPPRIERSAEWRNAADKYDAGLNILSEQFGGLLNIPIDDMKRWSDSMGFDPPEEYIYGRLAGRDLTREQKDELRKQDPDLYNAWRRARRYEAPIEPEARIK